MKRLLVLILLISLTIIPACQSEIVSDNNDPVDPVVLSPAEKKLIQSSNKFSFEIFKSVTQAETEKNIFISPLSISMALGMTYNGAAGSTKEGMHTTLQFGDLTTPEINQSYKNIIDLLTSLDPKVMINLANSIWANQNYTFVPEFMQTNREYFYATIENVNFGDPATTDRINQWVDNSTNGLIKKIFEEPLDPQVVMALLNAIYFKGDWTVQFADSLTQPDQFTTAGGNQIPVQMMERADSMMYFENEFYQAVDLPYGDKRFSMVVILPKLNTDLQQLIDNFNDAEWAALLNGFQLREGEFKFPKFKTEYEIKLNDILSAMGMSEAFAPNAANFTNMYAPGGLFIDLVKHKSFIKVDEVGTEAAAVTVVVVRETSIGNKFYMKVDRPFIFAIRENETQSILFMGKMIKPEWSE